MAESPKTPVVVPAPAFKFDKERCLAHLTQVHSSWERFAGKRNCNPYLLIGAKLDPLLFAVNKGEDTKELQDAVLALDKNTIPWIAGFKPSEADKQELLKSLS